MIPEIYPIALPKLLQCVKYGITLSEEESQSLTKGTVVRVGFLHPDHAGTSPLTVATDLYMRSNGVQLNRCAVPDGIVVMYPELLTKLELELEAITPSDVIIEEVDIEDGDSVYRITEEIDDVFVGLGRIRHTTSHISVFLTYGPLMFMPIKNSEAYNIRMQAIVRFIGRLGGVDEYKPVFFHLSKTGHTINYYCSNTHYEVGDVPPLTPLPLSMYDELLFVLPSGVEGPCVARLNHSL